MASRKKGYGSGGGMKGQSINTVARHVRSSKMSAIQNRNKTGPAASKSRPMEFKYRGVPWNPRANIKGC